MMPDFGMWMQQALSRPGILACGVKTPQATEVLSGDASVPESKIRELMRVLAETTAALRQDQLGAGQWRWLFADGQVLSARRPDGATALLVAKSQTAKPGTAERLLLEFVSMEAF